MNDDRQVELFVSKAHWNTLYINWIYWQTLHRTIAHLGHRKLSEEFHIAGTLQKKFPKFDGHVIYILQNIHSFIKCKNITCYDPTSVRICCMTVFRKSFKKINLTLMYFMYKCHELLPLLKWRICNWFLF